MSHGCPAFRQRHVTLCQLAPDHRYFAGESPCFSYLPLCVWSDDRGIPEGVRKIHPLFPNTSQQHTSLTPTLTLTLTPPNHAFLFYGNSSLDTEARSHSVCHITATSRDTNETVGTGRCDCLRRSALAFALFPPVPSLLLPMWLPSNRMDDELARELTAASLAYIDVVAVGEHG